MHAGLPGTGLGGLFYILLALWMPVAELYATLRGRSSRARWRLVGTQFAIACGIIAAVGGTVAFYVHLVGAPRTLGMDGPALALAPVVLAGVLLSVLVAVLRVWARLEGPPPAPTSAPTARREAEVLVGQGSGSGPTDHQ
jgi:hypothetical protein